MDDLISVLAVGETVKPTAWQKRAKDETGISPARFWQLMKTLKDEGNRKVTTDGKSEWTRLV